MNNRVAKFVAVTALFILPAVASGSSKEDINTGEAVEQTVTIQGLDGTKMDMTQSLEKNEDGTYTVISLEPKEKVREFFERQCASIGSRWVGFEEGETVITEGVIYSFTCEQ